MMSIQIGPARHFCFSSIVILLLIGAGITKTNAQAKAEAQVLKRSAQIFAWEISGRLDSLRAAMSDSLQVVNSRGEIQNKSQYLATLANGNFKHDAIDIDHEQATVTGQTAVVIGRGTFKMTLNGSKLNRRLSYMEVFHWVARKNSWYLAAIYASALPETQP